MSAQRQYTRRFIAAVVAYAVLLVASLLLLERIPAESALRYPVALLPVILMAFGVAAFMAYLWRCR